MEIIILDGYTANPGDLSWERLEKLGNLTVYDRTPKEDIVSRCINAEIVFTNKTPLDKETLNSLPKLKFIGVLATGYNIVDIGRAKELGITVCNIPSYSTMSVAQNVFALLLEITNNVAHYTQCVKEGKWAESKDFCFTDTNLMELAGKQMGIIGLGEIGSRVARIAMAFGMNVAAFTSKPQEMIYPVNKLDLDELFKTSDVISLHCPLTDKTYNLVNRRILSLMKRSAILINTGRGPLVDESALEEALKEGLIAGAGIDVVREEPPSEKTSLLKAPNLVVTPHISWATKEARQRLINMAITNLECFLEGKPENVVE